MFGRCISSIFPRIPSCYRYHTPLCTMAAPTPPSPQPVSTPPTTTPQSPSRKVQFYRRVLPETCISFSSTEGKEVFKEALHAGHMEAYFGLAAQFRTQDEPAFCGLSTLVMALNTLEVDPKRVWKGVWRWYHENMLDCCVSLDQAARIGITMDEFACVASCNTLNVNMVRATEDASEDDFRSVVKELTQNTDEVIVTSYSRAVVQQTGDGHFSPIGGYHPDRDLVLVLDTARFKYPPHWVSLSLLFKAMQACDQSTGQPRGYLRLRRSDTIPLVLFRWADGLSLPMLDAVQDRSSGIAQFLQAWEKWLFTCPGETCSNVLSEAVNVFITAMRHIPAEETILTTQLDIHCPEMLSAEHGCIVMDLLIAMEGTPLFELVQNCLNQRPEISQHLGRCLDRQVTCRQSTCCIRGDMQGDAASQPVDCIPPLPLRSAHFITILLLAWPYPQCGESMGHQLKRATQAQLCYRIPALQYEVAQLTRQFNVLMKHQERCQDCRCSKAN